MPSEITEFEDKLPSSLETVISDLYQVKDALIRNAHLEAIKHLGDSIAKVQNELDWCYRTDRVLPFAQEFLLNTQEAINAILVLQTQWKKEQTKAIIENIDSLTTELSHITNKQATWQAPEASIDVLEQEYRQQLYGYTDE